MNFKIETAKMAYILSKVGHGVGKKYTLPITEYLYIRLENGELLVRSTNGVNFVTVEESEIKGTDGECVVKADMLIKLVDKTTKPELSFKLTETYLEVKGNGTHKVPVLSDPFPTYNFNTKAKTTMVSTDVLKRVFKVNEAAIAHELILPYLTGYNLGETCITTDGINMCINNTKITEERVLITQALADLISKVFNTDNVIIQKEGNKMLISGGSIVVFGTELDGLREYPDITPILGYAHESSAKVSKQELLNVIDRLSLFVDQFENNGIRLTFGAEGIDIEDLKKNSQEFIEYVEGTNAGEAVILMNIDYMKKILSVVSADVVDMKYDPQLPVRIDDGQVTFFLSTMNAGNQNG